MSEASDIIAAKSGDREAAGRVLAVHRGLIVQWCNQMVEPGLELDDMIQEAHIAGLSAIRWFKPRRGYKFASYLKVCVRNRLATWRQDRRQRALPQEPKRERRDRALDLELGSGGALTAAYDRDLEMIAELNSHDNFCLLPMLKNLSKRDRTVIELRFGLTGGGALGPVSVARRLGLSEAQVRVIEQEAKDDLRFMAGSGYDPAG